MTAFLWFMLSLFSIVAFLDFPSLYRTDEQRLERMAERHKLIMGNRWIVPFIYLCRLPIIAWIVVLLVR